MSFDFDTSAALIAVLASAAYLLRGALAAATRFLVLSRSGTGPRICKGCCGGGCKASSVPAPRAALITIERRSSGF